MWSLLVGLNMRGAKIAKRQTIDVAIASAVYYLPLFVSYNYRTSLLSVASKYDILGPRRFMSSFAKHANLRFDQTQNA